MRRLFLFVALMFMVAMPAATFAQTIPSLSTKSLTFKVGEKVSTQLSIDNAPKGPGFTWGVITSSLPGGLSISEVGVLSGKPTKVGTYNVSVFASQKAVDAKSKPIFVAGEITIEIKAAELKPAAPGTAATSTPTPKVAWANFFTRQNESSGQTCASLIVTGDSKPADGSQMSFRVWTGKGSESFTMGAIFNGGVATACVAKGDGSLDNHRFRPLSRKGIEIAVSGDKQDPGDYGRLFNGQKTQLKMRSW